MRGEGGGGPFGVGPAVVLLLAATACISGTSLDDRPTEARVQVEGTASGPLRLVVSTDFHEERTASGEVARIIDVADTSQITVPFEATILLGDLGGIIVEVSNTGSESAQLALRVQLNRGHGEDVQEGSVPAGGMMRYFFLYYLGP